MTTELPITRIEILDCFPGRNYDRTDKYYLKVLRGDTSLGDKRKGELIRIDSRRLHPSLLVMQGSSPLSRCSGVPYCWLFAEQMYGFGQLNWQQFGGEPGQPVPDGVAFMCAAVDIPYGLHKVNFTIKGDDTDKYIAIDLDTGTLRTNIDAPDGHAMNGVMLIVKHITAAGVDLNEYPVYRNAIRAAIEEIIGKELD